MDVLVALEDARDGLGEVDAGEGSRLAPLGDVVAANADVGATADEDGSVVETAGEEDGRVVQATGLDDAGDIETAGKESRGLVEATSLNGAVEGNSSSRGCKEGDKGELHFCWGFVVQ